MKSFNTFWKLEHDKLTKDDHVTSNYYANNTKKTKNFHFTAGTFLHP